MESIHEDTHDWALGPRWTVIRQPDFTTDPRLVEFTKHSRTGLLLRRIALWNGRGWDPSRWVPAHPGVPRTLLGIVERHMKASSEPLPNHP